jgi:hypothetical protein
MLNAEAAEMSSPTGFADEIFQSLTATAPLPEVRRPEDVVG